MLIHTGTFSHEKSNFHRQIIHTNKFLIIIYIYYYRCQQVNDWHSHKKVICSQFQSIHSLKNMLISISQHLHSIHKAFNQATTQFLFINIVIYCQFTHIEVHSIYSHDFHSISQTHNNQKLSAK
jgi:hypothetical protein